MTWGLQTTRCMKRAHQGEGGGLPPNLKKKLTRVNVLLERKPEKPLKNKKVRK
jgi:hypothetical protein